MPLQTETVDLEAERERLADEMDDRAEEQLEWAESDSTAASEYVQQLRQEGYRLEEQRRILAWFMDEYDTAELTVAGPSTGEINLVEDFVDDHQKVRHRDAFVAVGTRDAPYLEHDPDAIDPEEFGDTVERIVSELPLPFVRWAEGRVSELAHLGGDMGNEYTELLLDKATSATSTDGSG